MYSLNNCLQTRKTKSAHELFKRASVRLPDDYNKEVEEGLHITSMAGSYCTVAEGFAGMRVKTTHFILPLAYLKIGKTWHLKSILDKIFIKLNSVKIFQCSLSLTQDCFICK